MGARFFAFLCGLTLLASTLSAAPVFTSESRLDKAVVSSAAGGHNETQSDTLTDFSPGNQAHNISYLNPPVYSAVVTANATTSYTDATYSFSTYDDASTNIGVTGIGSEALASFESHSYFHLDQTTTVEVSGTVNGSIPLDTGTEPVDESATLQITDTSTFSDKLFTVPGNGPFDFTRTLPAGNYFFRIQAYASNVSTGTDTGSVHSTLILTGTLAIPEPAELTLLAGSLPLLLRRRARR